MYRSKKSFDRLRIVEDYSNLLGIHPMSLSYSAFKSAYDLYENTIQT